MKKSASLLLYFLVMLATIPGLAQTAKQPNFIIILADDLGYGDLSSYGHPTIRTPHLDKMAYEGTRFTQFYVAANVCSPSRAALLTGRLPIRNGVFGTNSGNKVFFTNSMSGLPKRETTLAQALKGKGYQTAIVGKWHLGHLPQFLPLNYGFDHYFGIPYSNDMGNKEGAFPPKNGKPFVSNNPPLPLYRNEKVVETEPDQNLLTQRFTREVTDLITKNKSRPFFIYYASPFPHVPLHASPAFSGKSKRGPYGDVVEELDWSVGQILNKLKELKLDKNTFVVFLSDNGPWLMKSLIEETGGSAGLLYEAKASTYEGGMRVPAIAWMPGTVKANQISSAVATSMDLFPTILQMASAEIPKKLDGNNIKDLLTGKKDKVTDIVYYYDANNLYAIRKGPYKAHFQTNASYSPKPAEVHNPPLLYNLEHDPSEKYEIGKNHPEIIEELISTFKKHQESIEPVDAELDKREARKK